MLTGKLRPTTIEGIKSLATELRKKQGCKHSLALDLAAREARFQSFRHAQQTLGPRRAAEHCYYLFMTAYWRDKTRSHLYGRETLKITLSKPISAICDKFALRRVRGFISLRMVASDHFVRDKLAESQHQARHALCTAERSIRFMERTGLVPCRAPQKIYPKRTANEKLPDSDHVTYWIDPSSDQFILADEPYRLQPNEAARNAWARKYGWNIEKTQWPGMYNPYHCDLYIATDGQSGYDLRSIATKINAIPAPLVPEDWRGESSSSWTTFVSPMATTPQDVRRARSRGTIFRLATSNSIPYVANFGFQERRPAGKLTFEGHSEAGQIIKATLAGGHLPWAAHRRLNAMRSTLEDWMCEEIARDEQKYLDIVSVYYGDYVGDINHLDEATSKSGTIKLLRHLKDRLLGAYPDCAPLRRLTKAIDTSIDLADNKRSERN